MGKEKNKTKIKYSTAEQEEILKFLIVIVLVMIAVGGIYIATRLFVTKDFFKTVPAEEEIADVPIDYSVAIMGQILNRPYDDYYVLIYDTDGDYKYDMPIVLDSYNKKEKKLHMYTVDLSNILNDGYYDPDKVNVNAKSLDEMKVGDLTLLRVKKGQINKYIVDLAKIKEELGIEEK